MVHSKFHLSLDPWTQVLLMPGSVVPISKVEVPAKTFLSEFFFLFIPAMLVCPFFLCCLLAWCLMLLKRYHNSYVYDLRGRFNHFPVNMCELSVGIEWCVFKHDSIQGQSNWKWLSGVFDEKRPNSLGSSCNWLTLGQVSGKFICWTNCIMKTRELNIKRELST